MSFRSALPAALAPLLLSACTLESTATFSFPPNVRLANAAPSTTAITAHINGSTDPLTSALAPKSVSGCLLILPATHDIAFRESGNTRGSVSGSYAANGSYTVLLVSAGATYRALALGDNDVVATGNHGLRFINATSAAGDVYVTPPGAPPGPSHLAISNLGRTALSNENPAVVQRASSDTRIRLYDVGTTTTARADITLGPLSARRIATIVFYDPASGEPGAFQIDSCS